MSSNGVDGLGCFKEIFLDCGLWEQIADTTPAIME